MQRGKASPKTSRRGRGKSLRKNNNNNNNTDIDFSRTVNLSSGSSIMFPPRLRASGRVAFNAALTFSGSPNSYQYMDINNPITLISGQIMSGLAWIISGQQTNGSSYSPYVLGIVRSVDIEVYAKTAASPNSNTGALVCLYPLSPGTSTSSLSLTQAEEQFGRSNIIELPLGLDTVSRSKPLIRKTYKLWELFGVTEDSYMNNYALYSFGYAGLLSGVPTVCIALQVGLESASGDTSYSARTNVIVTMHMEFFNRNQCIVTAPHS
jgi:hypothetical protein